MTDVLNSLALLAADPGPRGDNPEGAGGILIILGIVLAVAVGGFLLHLLIHRFGRTRQRAMERHPAPPGRVGRTE